MGERGRLREREGDLKGWQGEFVSRDRVRVDSWSSESRRSQSPRDWMGEGKSREGNRQERS